MEISVQEIIEKNWKTIAGTAGAVVTFVIGMRSTLAETARKMDEMTTTVNKLVDRTESVEKFQAVQEQINCNTDRRQVSIEVKLDRLLERP